MYDDAMDAVHNHLVHKSTNTRMTYTSELIPEQNAHEEMYVTSNLSAFPPDAFLFRDRSWRLVPKQDHLVCFLGGSLMLGATKTGALVHQVSIPPRLDELSEQGKRDWGTGIELVKTCLDTHDTATYVFARTIEGSVRRLTLSPIF